MPMEGPSFDAARMEDVAEVLAFVHARCAEAGVPQEAVFALHVAVEEVFTNIIRHGYEGGGGRITSDVDVEGDGIAVTLADEAPVFDPAQAPMPDLDARLEERREGGMGWYLVHKLMDEVRHRAGPEGGNVVTLVKRFGG